MNLRNTGIIIRREYRSRVRKKSFLLITFIAPVLFAALCILPAYIMKHADEEQRRIAVIDRSGIVMPVLEDSRTVDYVDYGDFDLDSVKAHLGDLGYDAVLSISELDTVAKSVGVEMFSEKPMGVAMTENVTSRVNAAVESYRISSYSIAGLDRIMNEVKSDVRVMSYTIAADGSENVSESSVYMIVSMLLGMIIYMFISIFGGMVMSGVIEEKSSRVVEVLVSSVKATELMFGKITGIALVALTQFLLWIVLTLGIVSVASRFIGPDAASAADVVSVMGGMDGAVSPAEVRMPSGGMATIMSTLGNMNLTQILTCFFIFFLFGYMLYASIFAAIGSAVESEGDSQQLQLPVTIPLLIGFLLAFYAFKAPDSPVVVWGSMIPFTSPIVMLSRLPFGVPDWQVALSLAILVFTFVVFAWASSKMYKVGILMFGKKSTWKDLWTWFKQK